MKWLVCAVVVGAAGCGDDLRPPARAALGGFDVVAREGIAVSRGGVPVLAELRGAIETRRVDAAFEMQFGAFKIEEPVDAEPWRTLAVEDARLDGGTRVRLELSGGGTGVIEAAGDGALAITLKTGGTENRLAFSYPCAAGEHFQGLGGQAYDVDHRGETVPLWVQEEGIGKVETDDYGPGIWILHGRRHSTHTPLPIFVSSRGYALAWETDARSIVSLCDQRAGAVRVEVWEGELRLKLFAGPTPKQAIERVTAWTGRPGLPPAFTWAPWLDAMFGSANVRRVAAKLRTEGVPSSVIWTEDWRGGNDEEGFYVLEEDWEVDRALYPDLEAVATDLHDQGFKFLTYNNTFLSKSAPVQAEAIAGGHTIKSASGGPYLYTGVKFEDSTMVDLTSAAARAWTKQKFLDGLRLGADGWMADFGEWLPDDAVLASGESALLAHNRYPVEWARLNKEVFDSVGDGVERVYFMRSAYLGSQPLVQVIWAGDQETDFSKGDGIKCVIPKGIGLGVTGFPFYAHDIGGYSSVHTGPTTEELWFRWVTLGALTPVMRTHHGRAARRNWQWESSPESIAHFRRWAKLHIRLYPYLRAMAGEAVARGTPMFRSMALEWPAWEPGWTLTDQYLLGDRIVVAPVQDAGAVARDVALPAGAFFPLLGGAAVMGGGAPVRANAPKEEIPAYVRAGSLLVLLPERVDTLVDDRAAGVTSLRDVGDEREIWLWPGAGGDAGKLDEGGGLIYQWSGEGIDLAAPTWNGAPVTAVDGTYQVTGTGTLALGGARLFVGGGAADRRLQIRVMR